MLRRTPFSDTCPRAFLSPIVTAVFVASSVQACSDEGAIVRLTVKGEFQPDTLEYGEVSIGSTKTLTADLKNTGTPIFTIDNIEVPRSFALDGRKTNVEGTIIQPGEALELGVTFLAAEQGEFSEVLRVKSGEKVVELKLHAIAVLRRTPMLTLEPTTIDFGAVEIDSEARAPVTIRNSGTAPGVIDRVSLASTGLEVRLGDEYRLDWALPLTVNEGASFTVDVVFKPAREGPRSDTMLFGTSGASAPLELQLNGQGRVPLGEVLCAPSSVDFGRVERGQVVARDVVCSARGGPSRFISAILPGSEPYFFVPSPPPTTDLAPNESVTVRVEYRPDGLPTMHYSDLTVTYNGPRGPAMVMVPLTGEVIPPPPSQTAISVVLRWDTNFTDVDLHLVRPGGTAFGFDDSDCYYANRSPDWGTFNNQADDPFLDVDDIDGFGPETINLSEALPGTYQVLLHYFSDHDQGNSTATVEVYVGGSLAGTFMRNLSCDELWAVGTVQWNGTGGTFSPTNTVMPNMGRGVCL